MSPRTHLRLWSGFYDAARREPPGGPRRTVYKSLAAQLAYGAGLAQVAASLDRQTRAYIVTEARPSHLAPSA